MVKLINYKIFYYINTIFLLISWQIFDKFQLIEVHSQLLFSLS